MADRRRNPVRVVMVVQDRLLRDILSLGLRTTAGVDIVGVYDEPSAALREVAARQPDVAVLSIDEGRVTGVQLALRLREAVSDIGVVLLSTGREIDMLSAIPNNRLLGWSYLLNRSATSFTALVRAIQVTAAKLLDLDGLFETAPPRSGATRPLPPGLTSRQLEILELLARGLTNAAIARHLDLREKTIENQLAAVYGKLGLDGSRTTSHLRVTAAGMFLRSIAPQGAEELTPDSEDAPPTGDR